MTNSDADSIVAGFTERMAQLRARAQAVQNRIGAASGTATAPDGAVTVTVGSGGALLNISLGDRAAQYPPQRLAALVMELVGKAQRQASAQVSAAFGDLVDGDPQAMDVLDRYLPHDPDAEPDEPGPERGTGDDDFSDPW